MAYNRFKLTKAQAREWAEKKEQQRLQLIKLIIKINKDFTNKNKKLNFTSHSNNSTYYFIAKNGDKLRVSNHEKKNPYYDMDSGLLIGRYKNLASLEAKIKAFIVKNECFR